MQELILAFLQPNVLSISVASILRAKVCLQEKLVSFMAPKRDEEPAMATQLFRNLFGHGRVV